MQNHFCIPSSAKFSRRQWKRTIDDVISPCAWIYYPWPLIIRYDTQQNCRLIISRKPMKINADLWRKGIYRISLLGTKVDQPVLTEAYESRLRPPISIISAIMVYLYDNARQRGDYTIAWGRTFSGRTVVDRPIHGQQGPDPTNLATDVPSRASIVHGISSSRGIMKSAEWSNVEISTAKQETPLRDTLARQEAKVSRKTTWYFTDGAKKNDRHLARTRSSS